MKKALKLFYKTICFPLSLIILFIGAFQFGNGFKTSADIITVTPYEQIETLPHVPNVTPPTGETNGDIVDDAFNNGNNNNNQTDSNTESNNQTNTDQGNTSGGSSLPSTTVPELSSQANTLGSVYVETINTLQTYADVFPAYINLPDGNFAYGIGYSDLESGYGDDQNNTYFSAGFIPYKSEQYLLEQNNAIGSEIVNLNLPDTKYGFVFDYTTSVSGHFISENMYVTYTTDQNGFLNYTETPFNYTDFVFYDFNEDLGSVFNYDTDQFYWHPNSVYGNYEGLTGESMSQVVNYDKLAAEVQKVIETQDLNYSTIDIENMVHVAEAALESYFLQNQQETFMGIPVETLLAEMQKLEADEYFTLDAEGNITTGLATEPPPPAPTATAKWLTGLVCGLAVVGGIALTMIAGPVGPIVGGAIIGFAVEGFMQVVVGNVALTHVDWGKLAIAAVAGAIGGAFGHYFKAAGLATRVVGDAVIGGVTEATFTLMDGGSGVEALASFGIGVGLGVGLGLAFEFATPYIVRGIKSATNGVKKALTNLDNSFRSFLNQLDEIFEPRYAYQTISNVTDNLDNQVFSRVDDAVGDVVDDLDNNLDNVGNNVDNSLDDLLPTKSEGYTKLTEIELNNIKATIKGKNGNLIEFGFSIGSLGTLKKNMEYHMFKHGLKMGFDTAEDYIDDAYKFVQEIIDSNVRPTNFSQGVTPNSYRYELNDKFIIFSLDGWVVSYGLK